MIIDIVIGFHYLYTVKDNDYYYYRWLLLLLLLL